MNGRNNVTADTVPGAVWRRLSDVNGLDMKVLEAGRPGDPVILLLHGFPELAYSWRKVIGPLAERGFHVVAPDQRGYGGTTGWTPGYDVSLSEFGMLNLVADMAALVGALGAARAHCVVGHDFGSPVAAWCALTRPETFGAAMLMSAPFAGPGRGAPADMAAALAALDPPRKHYQLYYGERGTEAEMLGHPAGFARVLRAYYHCKSADWPTPAPHRLADWSAAALAEMPRYYIMDRDAGMADTALSMAPPAGADCGWLTDAELQVYVDAFTAAGLQAPLNWYRHATSGAADLAAWAGRRIEVPTSFTAGAADWGVWQAPGAFEAMAKDATADWRGARLIEGAGHWVQQERPEETLKAITDFLNEI